MLQRLLFTLLVLRWVLHALYLPVFEGPDEPFHLARARLFADAYSGQMALSSALEGKKLDDDLLRALHAYPCGEDLHRAFDCPPMSGADAELNVLFSLAPQGDPESSQQASIPSSGHTTDNYQAHQPPLYYALAGGVLALAPGLDAPRQILLLRLLAVAVSALGAWLLLSWLRPPWSTVFLAGLWLPGATESLIRVANDAPVFLWCALTLRVVARHRAATALPALLLAVGPLLKLTALPIVAFSIVDRLANRQWREGLVLAAAGGLFAPLQWLRGWAWGGTLEVEAGLLPSDPMATVLLGLAHSAYTFVKTAVWLGGWSVFRPPAWVLVVSAGMALFWLVSLVPAKLAPEGEMRRPWPHAVAWIVAVSGFVVFALGKRQLFHVWGAVGGWYAWAWWPWLALAASDLFSLRESARQTRILWIGTFLWVLATNLAWAWIAHQVYGAVSVAGATDVAGDAVQQVSDTEVPEPFGPALAAGFDKWP